MSLTIALNPLSKTRQAARLVVVILLAWLLAACSSVQAAPQVGDLAPDFTLTTTDGATVSLSDYQGRQAVLLYFHMAVG